VADETSTAESAAFGDLIDWYAIDPVAWNGNPTSPAQRHGAAEQQPERERERTVRRRVVEAARGLFDLGWLWRDVADFFRVAGRTLRHWCHELFDHVCPLGRPRQRSSREARNEVIHFLDELGPGVGVPTLRECFPAMSRAELDELLKRYRRVWRERHREPLRVLRWPIVGRVWAIDYAEPPRPIDGTFPYLLAVRDLASGMQLHWQPVTAATGEATVLALESLFARHGAPLVLKSDNGSHFTAEVVLQMLHAHRVECLLSPPAWPRYNGGIEAGIGSLTQRTNAMSARAGHVGDWSWDDVAGAMAEANALARPRGAVGPSPQQLWRERTTITIAERDAFAASVSAHLANAKERQCACEGKANDVWSERAMTRVVIRRALEECGYLHYQRRSILPPIKRSKAASIT
jgi:transposase InsO family protein